MNRTELRAAVGHFAEKAEHAYGQPSPADIATARELFDSRKEALSSQIQSNIRVKWWNGEIDWNSWSSLAEFFRAYYAALVELQNRMAIPQAEMRLRGI